MENVTQYNTNVNLPQENVSRVNTALVSCKVSCVPKGVVEY